MSDPGHSNKVQDALGSRNLVVATLLLAAAVSFPSLWRGLHWDDIIRQEFLLGRGQAMEVATHDTIRPTDLLTTLRDLFVLTSPEVNAILMDRGVIPWWSYEHLLLAHIRPIASFTHWLDYQLWPDSGVAMHAQSILLYAVACALLALFYRRLMTPVWVAGLAALLYAVDDAHVVPVVWIANRNALIGLLFGVLALITHDRWRRDGYRPGALLAPIFLALSVLSAELGVATGAYLLAHALFIERGPWSQRIRVMAPYVAIGVLWVVLYRTLGFGAYGSGLYVDPGREPMRFFFDVIEQGPVFFLAQWVLPDPIFYYVLSDSLREYVWVGAIAFIALVVSVFLPLLRIDQTARFWGAGMLLSLLLVCGIHVTTARPFLFVGIGAMGLIAQFIHGFVARPGWIPDGRVWRVRARLHVILYVGVHAIFSPLHFVYRTVAPAPTLMDLDHTVDVGLATGSNQVENLVIVNAPCSFNFFYFRQLLNHLGHDVPGHIRLLAPGTTSLELTRLDSNSLSIRPTGGYLVPPGSTLGERGESAPDVNPAYYYQHYDKTFRADVVPMMAGQKVSITGMSAEIISTTIDGRPLEAKIRFSEPLEAPVHTWRQWDWNLRTFVRFVPPPIGNTLHIAGPKRTSLSGLEPKGLFE